MTNLAWFNMIAAGGATGTLVAAVAAKLPLWVPILILCILEVVDAIVVAVR